MAVATYVGSFIKQTATGNQDITIPVDLTSAATGSWAVIFWSGGQGTAPAVWTAHAVPMIGFAANGGGSVSQYSVGAVSYDNLAATDSGRRLAAKAITYTNPGLSQTDEADFAGFPSATTMRLNWTAMAAGFGGIINYMIITGLTGAKAVQWNQPAAAGVRAVTGVGFNPDLVLNIHAYGGNAPVSNNDMALGFGAMNKHGQQWANAFHSHDTQDTTNTSRYQQTDACIAGVVPTDTVGFQAHFLSMDADGFSTYFSTTAGGAFAIASLCLDGVSSKVGAFISPDGVDGNQLVNTRHNFTVRGALLSGISLSNTASPSAHTTWALGGTDNTNQRASGIYDLDALATTDADSIWRNDAVVFGTASSTAYASWQSSTTSSMTLTWAGTTGASALNPGREFVYLLIGDAGTNAFPSRVAGSDVVATTSTAFSNQKKILRLSTGRLVSIHQKTTPKATLLYSDDSGVTWTEFSSGMDILGWSNGSMVSYVDQGGTERIVATWKQSGTGGGRSDGYIYVATAAASGTTLTWATAVQWNNSTDQGYLYPDLTVCTEGTGARAMLVSSYISSFTDVVYRQANIDSSGAITFPNAAAALTTANTGTTNHTFPSIDIDPATKSIFASWFAGVGGTGKGIRFRKATYSAGSWSWATEREISTNFATSGGGELYRWSNCIFDGTRVMIGGLRLATGGAGDTLFLFERDAADTTTATRIFETVNSATDPNALYNGSLTYDSNGNIYLFGGDWNLTNMNCRKWNRSSGALEAVIPIDKQQNQGWVSAKKGFSGSKIEWIYTAGNNSPYTVKYDYIQLYNPQSGLTSPQNNTSANLSSGGTFKWSYYAPDAAVQTGWAFKRIRSDNVEEYWNNTSTSWQATEIYNSGTATQVTFGSGKWQQGQTYQWTVSVQNATGVSGYAPVFTVTSTGAATGVRTYVGSFTKPNTTGFQDVTVAPDLTNAPGGSWAIMFWTSGSAAASGTWTAQVAPAIGLVGSGGGITQCAIGASSRDNMATADSSRRMSAKALTLTFTSGSAFWSDDMEFVGIQSATSLRLNWTVADTASAYGTSPVNINYMIITGLTNSKVVTWNEPASAGDVTVSSVGFKPDLVFHMANQAASGVAVLPQSAAYGMISFGVMNKHGQQWANAVVMNDNVNPSQTARYQQTDACLVGTYADASSQYIYWEGHFRSMNDTGFTINYSTVATNQVRVASLCLQGISSKIGAFTKASNTANTTTVANQNFAVQGALFSAIERTPGSAPAADAAWMLGATDGTNQRAVALRDEDPSSPTAADSIWYNDKLLSVPDAGPTEQNAGTWGSATNSQFTVTFPNANSSNGQEFLYMLLGEASTDTFPSSIVKHGSGLTTNTLTAYFNQKKLATLSTGRIIAMVNEDTNGNSATYSYFFWSDDGVTWTSFDQPIQGASSTSISSYVDASGTDRLVAVWKQEGAWGGRTDQRIYIAVGTFDSTRTNISWGTAISPSTNVTNTDSPDVVAFADGNGGQAVMVVWVGNSYACYARYPIGADGVLGTLSRDGLADILSWGGLNDSSGTVYNVRPSIDADPVSKNVFVSWSEETTGAGKGIRFRVATHSGGNWTWGSEIEVDNARYVHPSLPNENGLICRYDGNGRVILGGNFHTGGSHTINVYESTNFISFSAVGSLAHVGSGSYGPSIAIDYATGDIYLFQSVYGAIYEQVFYRRYSRSGSAWQSPVYTDQATTAGTSITHFVNATYSAKHDRIHWVYVAGNNSDSNSNYPVRYDRIQLNRTPVVTLSSPANNLSVNLNTTAQQFTWTVTDADGDTQAKYVFRRRKPGATAYEYWTGSAWTNTLTEVTGTTNNVTITQNTWAGSKDWLWSVGVRDTSTTSPIGYSSERTLTNSAFTPTVTTHVGSFTKATATGNQDITIPVNLTAATAGSWAIMFWTTGSTGATSVWPNDDVTWTMYGFTTGATNSYSIAVGSDKGPSSADTHRRIAAKCMTFASFAVTPGVAAEADFVGFPTATSMRINWTTGGGLASNINYMIITGLSGANAIAWTTPTAAGDKTVTGVGFSPDLVFSATTTSGISSAIPFSDTFAWFGVGAFNKHGQQWANSFASSDAVNPSNTARWQQTDAFLATVGIDAVQNLQAHYKSMDADGFTANFSGVASGVSRHVVSLCVKGVSSKLGAFNASTTSGAQAIETRHGFSIKGALFSTHGQPPGGATANATWGMGASDGVNERTSYLTEIHGVTPAQTDSIWLNNKSLHIHAGAASTGATASVSFAINTITPTWSASHIAHEQLYLLIGDPNTNTTPALIGATTDVAATAYSDQRLFGRFSTGRLVAIHADSTTNAKFKYSDDGITWTDMNCDIAGWANGTIYISSDDQVFVAWKQTGTAGGRTDLYSYMCMGTPNASKTSLTWTTPFLFIGSFPEYDYTDLVAHKEGTVWRVHAVSSYVSGTTNQAEFWPITYTPQGVGSRTSSVNMGGSYGVAVHTFPSIDMNPTTKDLYVAWSAGGTGSGKGVRFKKATYYNGTWAWGTEREIDNTVYVVNSSAWIQARYVPAYDSIYLFGRLYTGSESRTYLAERNGADTTTTARLSVTTSDIFQYGTCAVDQRTGDAYWVSRTSGGPIMYQKWTRSNTTLGSRVELETSSVSDQHVNAGYYNGRIEWVYTSGNNSPYALKYDYLSVNATPSVTLVSPENGTRRDLNNNSQQFNWTYSDPEGNAQQSWSLRRRRDGHTTYEYWDDGGLDWVSSLAFTSTAATNVTVPTGKWKAGKVYYWSVGVRDNNEGFVWSEERKIVNTAATIQTYVGSFAKTGTTGNQDITIPVDLTTAPAGSWAIMFWDAGARGNAGVWRDEVLTVLGFVANGGGSISEYSVSTYAQDNTGTTQTSRRMAAKAISIGHINETLKYEANFVGFPSSTTMRVNWTTSNTDALTISYMIITGLSGAKAINWTEPLTAINKSVTGVGFSPDLVLHATMQNQTALPTAVVAAKFGFGVMNKHGQQWANAYLSIDGSTGSDNQRAQQTDSALITTNNALALDGDAKFVSMDPDGFTLNWPTVSTVGINVISLAIKGISSRLGAFNDPGAAGAFTIDSRHGFTPRALAVTSFGTVAQGAPVTHTMWSLGITDGTNTRLAGLVDGDALNPTQARSNWWTDGKIMLSEVGLSPVSTAVTNSLTTLGTNDFTLTSSASGQSVEGLYLLLGDAEVDTTPSLVSPTTNNLAVHYPNQRKLVRLSTGRLIAVYNDASNIAKFKYSDDGITWTDMQSDIADWVNGSLFADIDDYVWVAYRNNITTNPGPISVRRGTLNTAKTTITWTAALGHADNGGANYNYPDIVAHRNVVGSGWTAHVVYSYGDATSTYALYHPVTASAAGTLTAGTRVSIGNNYATTGSMHSYPSVDFNHVGDGKAVKDSQPHVYAVWSAGKAGSGFGIRHKKATYSNGVWTWGTEREIDSTHFHDGAGNFLSMVFDGTRVMFGGEHGSDIMLYERDAADTTTTVRTLAAGVSGATRATAGSIAYDQDQNIYILGVGGGAGAQPNYRKWTRATQVVSSQVFLESLYTGHAMSALRMAYDGRVDFIYTYGNNSPYVIKYDYIKTTTDEDDLKSNRWGIIPI